MNIFSPHTASKSKRSHKWCVGDWVEIRPLSDILATLDEHGALEAMPFMPEMIPYCGRRFQIVKVAHKTCDSSGWEYLRKLDNAVHLNTYCDGSRHGGCQAMCLFFWKTAWLRKVDGEVPQHNEDIPLISPDHARLQTRTHNEAGEEIYYCQATEIKHAAPILVPWNISQYVRDVATRNVSLGVFTRYTVLAILRVVKLFVDDIRFAVKKSDEDSTVRKKSPPSPPSDLKPGDIVRIKSRHAIMETLTSDRKNFGLPFDTDMVKYCGTTHKIIKRVERIIDEKTGKMLNFSRDCYALHGVTCTGLDCRSRLFCPRSMMTFWRGVWLERVRDIPPPEKRVACDDGNIVENEAH